MISVFRHFNKDLKNLTDCSFRLSSVDSARGRFSSSGSSRTQSPSMPPAHTGHQSARRPRDIMVNIGNSGVVQTKVEVHVSPEGKESVERPGHHNTLDEEESCDGSCGQCDESCDRNSPIQSLLVRSGSDRSDQSSVSIPMQSRHGSRYKCNDSMASDTSSGFHSDFTPEESSTDYHGVHFTSVLQRETLL